MQPRKHNNSNDMKHFGALPQKYGFVFNPYPDMRLSSCPFCRNKTGQRKVPLVIHVQPFHTVSLNYTCRYCKACDLLIAHKDEIEHLLSKLFLEFDPSSIGNEYFVLGTLEKKAWKEGVNKQKSVEEMRAHIHDFKTWYQELRVRSMGWYPKDQVPPVRQPPSSKEWIAPSE